MPPARQITLGRASQWPATRINPASSSVSTRKASKAAPSTDRFEKSTESTRLYAAIHKLLPPAGQKQLEQLLEKGILHQSKAEDGHSTLYHLHALVNKPRQKGYQGAELLREIVEILAQPSVITQTIGPLSDDAIRKILAYRQHPETDPQHGTLKTRSLRPVTAQDLDVEVSASCVAACLMYCLAVKEPAELARHIAELTSPTNSFSKKTSFKQISPDAPEKAVEILKAKGIPFRQSGKNELTLQVQVPTAGVIRAIEDQHAERGTYHRNAVESIYQSALMHLATNTYDPATDFRGEMHNPNNISKGLSADEKTFLETILRGEVKTITYQSIVYNETPGKEGNYLQGYHRTFEETQADVKAELDKGNFVIVGLLDTDNKAKIDVGHEVTLTKAFHDPATGKLKFLLADSHNDIPNLVTEDASELIPRIHHATLPAKHARPIVEKIARLSGILVPDEHDEKKYTIPTILKPTKTELPNPFRKG